MERSVHLRVSLRISCFALLLSLGNLHAADIVVVDLWPDLKVDPAFGEEQVKERSKTDHPDRFFTNVSKPTLIAVLPDKPTGAAVIICPGGGYGSLAYDKEGTDVAAWLASNGIAGLILKYRLPRGASGEVEPVPLQDARQAMRVAKTKATEWHLDATRIGIMGFSAGGHLASTLATHFTDADRPAFAVLVYPVITFSGPNAHGGSRDNLLGKSADAALIERYCNERLVTAKTPPTFLVHAADDGVKIANSEMFSEALTKAGVANEFMHLEKGGHGFGLGVRGGEPAAWPARCLVWLSAQKFLTPP
ncbi:MAG TPA: alpha/beta hydrolase [Planctomycetota bacterium]|nr:alpha/beta hydrolase [Planctomycetota bacterium]